MSSNRGNSSSGHRKLKTFSNTTTRIARTTTCLVCRGENDNYSTCVLPRPAFTRPYDAECVLLKPADGMCLLDLGCGSGAAADYLASRCSVEILCVTNSRARADICQRKFQKFEGRVRVIVADFDDLDLPAESFDAIYALESIGYTKDLEAWLARCWQSLKPGGHLLIRSPGSLDHCHPGARLPERDRVLRKLALQFSRRQSSRLQTAPARF